jgi:hypothetical protein
LHPEYPWQLWRFSPSENPLPKDYWNDPKNVKEYLEWLAKELKVEKPEDWYRVRVGDVKHASKLTTVTNLRLYWRLHYDNPLEILLEISQHNTDRLQIRSPIC